MWEVHKTSIFTEKKNPKWNHSNGNFEQFLTPLGVPQSDANRKTSNMCDWTNPVVIKNNLANYKNIDIYLQKS